jgi:hypothetical protein
MTSAIFQLDAETGSTNLIDTLFMSLSRSALINQITGEMAPINPELLGRNRNSEDEF